ncbi:MAG: DUF4173 domain-containing protein [Candidatus Pacebacteria bacterium]|nr:DUF4173 domain-containing protein [Candidatus Paceibacterota bacterium]
MTTKKQNLYLIISFALTIGILADYLFYQKSIGISFFVFNLVVIIFSLILIRKFGIKINKIQVFILLALLLFSAGVFLRSSSFLTFFNFWGSIYLLFFFFSLFLNKNILDFSFLKYIISPPSFFLKSFRGAGRFIEKCKNAIPENKKIGSEKFRSVLKGVVIALPFLIIFCWLLSSADLVFQAYLGKIFNFDFNLSIISRTLIILVFTYIFLGVFSKIAGSKNGEEIQGSGQSPEPTSISTSNESEDKSLGFIESSTVLILIELLFLSFIIIQFFYLFGGKDYVWGIEEYITYSEYAKNGFNELLCVSIISFLLLYGLEKSSFRKSLKEKKIFKILSAVLIVEMSVIIYSAWTRMAVYVEGYGLTFSRFLVFVFLLWIFSVFLIFLYKKIFQEKKEAVFLFSIFCLSLIFWTGINIINPDVFIAKENIKRITQGKKLDSYYLSRLSVDAIPETVKIFQMDNVSEETKMEIARDLYYRCDFLFRNRYNYAHGSFLGDPVSFKRKLESAEKNQNKNWQSFNLSRKKALKALNENYEEIVEYQSKYFKKQAEECWKEIEDCKGVWGCHEGRCKMYEKNAEMDK